MDIDCNTCGAHFTNFNNFVFFVKTYGKQQLFVRLENHENCASADIEISDLDMFFAYIMKFSRMDRDDVTVTVLAPANFKMSSPDVDWSHDFSQKKYFQYCDVQQIK